MWSVTHSRHKCVLFPLLYILYTSESKWNHKDTHILKFTDDKKKLSWACNKNEKDAGVAIIPSVFSKLNMFQLLVGQRLFYTVTLCF